MSKKARRGVLIFGILYLTIGVADLISGASPDSRFYIFDNLLVRFMGLILIISSIGLFLRKEIARKGMIAGLILSVIEIFIGVPQGMATLDLVMGTIILLILYVPGLVYFSFYNNYEYFNNHKGIHYFNLKLTRSFVIPNFDEVMKNKIITYWGNKNAQFTKITDTEYQAKRGSLLSNLITLKMYKLKTTISIHISENNQVTCTLNINTMFQHVTNWNRKYWDLELETFESFLLNDDLRENEWHELIKKSKIKDFVTTLIVILTVLLTSYITTNIIENGTATPQFAQIFSNDFNKAEKTFTSEDKSVQLIASKDWKIKNNIHKQAILQMADLSKDRYIIVIDDSKADFADNTNIADYAALALDGMQQNADNVSISEPTKITINGYPALQYYFHGEVGKLKVSFNVTLIDTPETFYQILAWSYQSNFADYEEEFKTIISTFKSFGREPSAYLVPN